MASGDTKTEAMLNVLGNGGTGDEFRGCCNTKTQQYILDAIDRINELDPGGGGEDEIEFVDLTVTNIGTDTITVTPNKTTAEVESLVGDGKTVVYRLVVPQAVGGFAAGTYLLQTVMVSIAGIMASAVATPTPGDLVSYVFVQAPGAASGTIYIEGLGGGGDSVYSDKNTSMSETGGAVYIGNLNASQEEQPDPTASDSHFRYFWALPFSNSAVPESGSVNILGQEAGSGSVAIGSNAICRLDSQIAIGGGTLNNYSATYGSAIGYGAQCLSANAVALGHNAKTSRNGEVNVGTGTSGAGYNNTNYRVIGGVHDGVDAHDAMTVGQANALIDAINTALGSSIPHIGS